MGRTMWVALLSAIAVCSPISGSLTLSITPPTSTMPFTTPTPISTTTARPTSPPPTFTTPAPISTTTARPLPPPPPIDDAATYARYIVHYSDWTSLGHISHQPATQLFPSTRVFSMADGPVENSTGVPYIYTSFYDSVPRDLKMDPRCSMTMSLAQTEFCNSRNLDPEDPKCPQVMLTGFFIAIQNNTEEWDFAKNALFSRHPEMMHWPKGHSFFFAKLDIIYVQIVDNIGGSKYPSVADYYNSPPPTFQKKIQKPKSSRFNFLKNVEVNMIE